MSEERSLTPSPPLPDLIARYLSLTSVQDLAEELNVHRVTIYRWMMNGQADGHHDDHVTDALIGRIAEADGELDNARDSCSIARAREKAKFARMDFERRRPRLYGPKQELQVDTTVRVILNKPSPLHIDEAGKTIEADSQVLDSTRDEIRSNV